MQILDIIYVPDSAEDNNEQPIKKVQTAKPVYDDSYTFYIRREEIAPIVCSLVALALCAYLIKQYREKT